MGLLCLSLKFIFYQRERMNAMAKDYQEWFLQSGYDYKTTKTIIGNGICFYSVFMCHLSIEKNKRIMSEDNRKLLPKTYKLNYFFEELYPDRNY